MISKNILFEIKNMLDEGHTIKEISEKLNIAPLTVKRNGIKMGWINPRNPKNYIECKIIDLYVNNSKDSTQISKILSIDKSRVLRILNECGVEIRKVYHNLSAFEKIDSDQVAYLFGLFCADGWICPSTKTTGLYLQECDGYMVEKFASYLGDIKPQHREIGSSNGFIASIHSEDIVNNIMKHGIDNKKSYTLKFPNSVPEIYYPDFIRGYFDGDGSVSKNRTSFTGTYMFLERIKEIISECAKVSNNIKLYYSDSKNDITKQLVWTGKNQNAKIMRWMYKEGNAKLFLKRKYCKYAQQYGDIF